VAATSHGARGSAAADARSTLRTFVISELAILIFVVVVTAWLVASVPARVAAEPRFVDVTRKYGDGTVQVTIDPAMQGTNIVHVYAFTKDGAPDAAVKDLKMELKNVKRDIAGLKVGLRPAGPGHFTSAGVSIPLSGTWTANLESKQSKFEKSTASVTFRVRARSK
jgi:copper transport protein